MGGVFRGTCVAAALACFAHAASAQLLPVSPEPIRPPAGDAELQSLAQSIAAEAAELAKAIETRTPAPGAEADDATKAYLAAAQQLLESLRTYDGLLKEHSALRVQVRGLEDEQSAAQFRDELAGIQHQIDEVKWDRDRRRGYQVTPDDVKKAEAEWEAAKTDLAARIKAQEERAERQSQAAPLKERLAREAQDAQAALINVAAEHPSRMTAAADEWQRELAAFRLRQAQMDAAIALVRQERADLDARRDVRQSSQAEQRLPLVRELLAQHESRVERLKQWQTRDQLAMARDKAADVDAEPAKYSPYERAWWNFRYAALKAAREILEMYNQARLRFRFSEESRADLEKDLSAEQLMWTQWLDTVDRRTGERIQTYYQRIGDRIASRRARRDELRALYDETLDDRARIVERLDLLDDDIAAQFARLTELVPTEPNPEVVARYAPQIKEQYEAYVAETKPIRESLDQLVKRLHDAVRRLTEHVDVLATQRSHLYWSYLRVQDQRPWKFRLSRTQEEWEAEAPARREQIEALQRGLQSLTPTTAGMMAGGVALVLLLSAWLRAKLRRAGDLLEARITAQLSERALTGAPVSDRLHLQAIRFLARTSLVVWPCAAVWLCVRLSPLDGRIAKATAIMLMVAGVAAALISTLFSRSKPRFRLVPCSNVVAGHYRRWLRVLLWVSIIMVPSPAYLEIFEGAPYTRSYLWAAYKIVALSVVLIFAFDHQSVLRVVGRPEQVRYRLLYLIVSAAYPVFYLGVVALLGLQVLGYGALTTYIISGLTCSGATAIVAVLLVRYLRDLLSLYGRKLAAVRSAEETEVTGELPAAERPAAGADSGRQAGAEASDALPSDEQLWVSVASSLFRWGVALCAAVVILGHWGVSWVDLRRSLQFEIVAAGGSGRPAVTIGRALSALAILALTWVISRAARSFLESRVFPTYGALDRGGRAAVTTLLHYLALLIGLYFALSVLQIPLGALTVVLGTVGLGVGLGLQPLFVNFLSGLIILFERHLKVGDLIEIDGVLGEVTRVSLRATSVNTYDNVDLVIPNADFVSSKVVNWTLNDPRIRGKVEVGVSYDADPRLVERLLLQVAQESKLVLPHPPPRVTFAKFGDNSLEFVLFVWHHNVEDRGNFMTDSRYRIIELFRQHGLEMAFPQRTLTNPPGMPIEVRVETVDSRRQETRGRRLEEPPREPGTGVTPTARRDR